MNTSTTLCHLDQYCLLFVHGPEASKFLQGQVTCDVEQLTIQHNDNKQEQTSTLGAHCTHKGRVVFGFRAVAVDEMSIALCIPSDMIEIASAALNKYIVFSKAEVQNKQEEYQLIGIEGEKATSIIEEYFGKDNIPQTSDGVSISSRGIVLRLSDDRYELWLTTDQAKIFKEQYSDQNWQGDSYWQWQNTNAGLVQISPATSGLFTPHAINFHNIGNAISFKKGCYTGQEVVARMHYLGKLKRQLALFEIAPSSLGEATIEEMVAAPLYTQDKAQSIGEIASAAKYNHCVRILANVVEECAQNNQVCLDKSCTQILNTLTLLEK